MAASLVGMTARCSPEWEGGGGAAAQAKLARTRLMQLALADSEAYARVIDVLGTDDGASSSDRDLRLGAALDLAAELPLAIADAAADVVELAAHAAAECSAAVRGEILGAAVLADAAVHVAVHLVEINLATRPDDHRVAVAREVGVRAAVARRRAEERA
jgi:formiminotetrahydrofolate cyclodeaminase